MFSADWLGQAAHSAVQIACFGLWVTGCVLSLRNRPAAGTGLASTGFGLLALVQLLSLVTFVLFIVRVRMGGGLTIWPDTLALLFGGLTGIGQIAGAALVVAGATTAWRASRRDAPSPFDLDR